MGVNITQSASSTRDLAFRYGDERIQFQRIPRKSGAKRVRIKIHHDCRIEVMAPAEIGDAELLSAVQKRSHWIYRHLCKFRKQMEHITPRKYVSGESHYYLGRQYTLKVVQSSNLPEGVKLFRGKIEVIARERNPEKIKQLLLDWHKSRAKNIFEERLNNLLEKALWTTERPPLRIRQMRTQWGSCSPHGRLSLNTHLIKAPCECIDYVILHELCHLVEHNHSKRFYRLMTQVLPEWKKIKERLDSKAHRILTD